MVVAMDLGQRVTRGVYVRQAGRQYTLVDAVSLPSPRASGGWNSADELAHHFAEVHRLLGARTRRLILALPPQDALLRVAEMPDAPVHDLRAVLRHNSVRYLQQELKDHVFDCFVLSEPPSASTHSPADLRKAFEADFGDGKVRIHDPVPAQGKRKYVLAGGLPAEHLALLIGAATKAGLALETVTLSQMGLVQAGLTAMPAMMEREVCGFLDIGPGQTTLSIVGGGELVFTRTIATGAEAIASSLAANLNITPQVAEGLIMTMPEKVREKLAKAVFPLAEEVRASIDFFEEKRQKVVTKLFVSGGESKSDLIFHLLREELAAPVCERWNPVERMHLPVNSHGGGPGRDFSPYGSAIGAAVTALEASRLSLNLLSERREVELSKRRNPVRWVMFAAACCAFVLLAVAGMLRLRVAAARNEVGQTKDYLRSLENVSSTVSQYATTARDNERTMGNLYRQASGRFLWALPLNALQAAVVDDVTVVRLQLRQTVAFTEAVKPEKDIDGKLFPGKPAFTVEKTFLTITAKDFGQPPAAEKFIQAIAAEPYFRARLRPVNPIILRDRLPRHVDPDDTSRSYIPFTIECVFEERTVVDE